MATLRYRSARDRADQLGQVFTPPSIAALLINSIPVPDEGVRYILDLGAGVGALTRAALAAHPRAHALLVELDRHVGKILRSSLPARTTLACADALGTKWDALSTPSWILSNPPYGHAALTPAIRRMIDNSGLTIPLKGKWIRGDAAFVARTWGLSQIGTGIGLIVASPIIRDPSFGLLRQRLVGQMSGLCVTQLDDATFANAEVRAYLLSGMRAVSRQRRVLLRKADAAGTIVDEMDISFPAATRNLDIDFHRTLQRLGVQADKTIETLGSAGTSIVRGSRSCKDFERLGLRAFHTTDFDTSRPGVHLRGASRGYQTARSGHILIPRVGSRCLVGQTRVESGEGLFTDSVYRLTVTQKNQRRVWKTLASSFGAEWRLANASGSCAKHLTVQTLATMPLVG